MYCTGMLVRDFFSPKQKTNFMKFYLLTIALLLINVRSDAQRINLDVKNARLNKITSILTKETGISFTIHPGVSDAVGEKTIKVHLLSWNAILAQVLNKDSFMIELNGTKAQIKRRPAPTKTAIDHLRDSIAKYDLHGQVVDTANVILAGATILIKNSSYFNTSDSNGNFHIKVLPQDTIIISYMGFITREFTGYRNNFLQCILYPTATELPTFVSKGPYTMPKDFNPGNITVITADDINQHPVVNPLQALTGRVTGTTISQESGVGPDVNIIIQGRNSLSNGIGPLYFIDGVPLTGTILSQLPNAAGYFGSIQTPMPENIASIEVLRDADACAIYGARGANGVILIKTKRPAPTKTTFNVSIYTGQSDIPNRMRLMNTQQYLAMRHEALNNDNLKPTAEDYDLVKWDTTRYTNWQKEILGRRSSVTNAYVGMTGGNEQTMFSIGGGYRRENALFAGHFPNTTKSVDMALLHTADNKKFNADIGLHFKNNDNQLPIADITSSVQLAPNAPALYDSTGKLNWDEDRFQNPYGLIHQRYRAKTNNFLGSLRLSYELLPKLKLSAILGYNYIGMNESLVIPLSSMNQQADNLPQSNSHTQASNSITSWIIEPQASYHFSIKKAHDFDLLMGITFQESNQHQSIMMGSNYESDVLVNNISVVGNVRLFTDNSLYRYNGAYARVGYNYRKVLQLNFTGRKDGSSRFSQNNRTELFGSAGIAWLFTKMPFFPRTSVLDFGKLYANIGRTGNDQFADYRYYDTYGISTGYAGLLGLERTQLTSYLFRWEILIKSSIGLELRCNKRYTLSFNYYWNHTRNQLVQYDLPAVTGFKFTTANLPAEIRNTGLETELGIRAVHKNNFQLDYNINLTVPKNELVYYPNIATSVYYGTYAVGQPLDSRFVFKYTGVDPTTGLPTFADLYKDGQIDIRDKYPRFIGPTFFGGVGMTLKYKGLTFSTLVQFVKQSGYYAANMEMPGAFSSSGGNQPLPDGTRWTKDNRSANLPRYAANNMAASLANTMLTQSDFSIVDASYIRLTNVSVSWNVPASWTNRMQLRSVQFYLKLQNLATWSPFKGLDPSTQHFISPYRQPLQRTGVFGCSIVL